MDPAFWQWLITVGSTIALLAGSLATPWVQQALGKFIGGFVDHHFAAQLEQLKSDLRQTEARFTAQLKENEQRVRSLTEAALSMQSSRQVALNARRLLSVEKLWAAKQSVDRYRIVAAMAGSLNFEEMFKAADAGDERIQRVGEMMLSVTGVDFKKDFANGGAQSERPFVPPNVWALFSTYQSLLIQPALTLHVLATGTTKYFKREDVLKPALLLALPDYSDYIEKFGTSGYHLLTDVLEQRLLQAIDDMLEGRQLDAAALEHSAKLVAAAQKLNASMQQATVEEPAIPAELQATEAPEPKKSS